MVGRMTSSDVVCLHYQNPVGFERKDAINIAMSSWHLEHGVWELWVLYSATNDPQTVNYPQIGPKMIPNRKLQSSLTFAAKLSELIKK